MTKHTNKFNRISYTFLLFIFVLFSSLGAFGQQTESGKWKAKISEKDSQKIHISFYREKSANYQDDDDDDNNRSRGKHKDHVNGSSFEINDLQGLTIAQVNGAKSQVNFSVVREAGTIQLVGLFENGKGTGTWTFSPDANFITTMGSLGFNNISNERLFASAMLDIRTATVTELRNSGLKNLDYEDIFKATIFKVNSDYIREMNSAGFANLDMDDLVQARIFKIDAKYAGEILSLGFAKQSIEELVQFKIFKITPEFLSQMKSEGLNDLTPENLVQLKIFKIDSTFIQNARAKGFSNPSVGELVELKIHGKVK